MNNEIGMKTNKSLQKRLKVSKKGKVLARKSGHGHFNAKQKRVKQLAAKKLYILKLKKKTLGRYLP